MKCRILTAHGYLSFQPDATIQYRPTPGAWEEITVEAWDFQQVVPPDPGTTPPPAEGDWLGIPPAQNAEYVAAIKNALVAQGKDLSGPCGAYQVVENVAWGLRAGGCGTFFKDYGNMCADRSTDVVAYKDLQSGVCRIIDILGDAGGQNNPNWLEKEPEDISRWRMAEHPDTDTEWRRRAPGQGEKAV